MQSPTFRRLRALTGAAIALAALAAPSAQASNGTYTQILCGNPDNAAAMLPTATLPDGMSAESNLSLMSGFGSAARCDLTTSARGISINATSEATGTGGGAGLRYRSTPASFQGAEIYRAATTSHGWMIALHQGSGWSEPYGSPWIDRCHSNAVYGSGRCFSVGAGGGAFVPGNFVAAGTNGVSGFNFSMLCEVSNEQPSCLYTPRHGLTFYGAKVRLGDPTNPVVASDNLKGDLATDPVLRGLEELTYTATDSISGVYRARLLVDGVEKAAQVADANGGKCTDANPTGNADVYEFVHIQPCKGSVNGTLSVDTATLAEGARNLKVLVEDAAGNTITALNRNVTIDNIPAPVASAPPTISGQLRRGQVLTVAPASINAHGATSALTVARQWQRCSADGACVDIPDARGTTYTPTTADLNRSLVVVETWTNSEGSVVASSTRSPRITREDGTLPPGNDGEDNDGDGLVDEPGETTPTNPGDNPPATPVPESSKGVNGLNGNNGANGQNGAGERAVVNTAASAGAPNGEGASPRARLSAAFGSSTKGKVAYGKSLVARGRLVDESGRPIRNAIIDVAETAAVKGAKPVAGRPLVTDGDGQFSYTASSKAGTRTVAFTYRYLRQGSVVSQASLALTVKAGVQLRVGLKGIVTTYSGRVLAGSMPRGGKIVLVQGRAKGGPWQTFASRRATKSGKFSGKYRLKVRRPGKKLQFRVKVVAESGWNFGAVTSKSVTKTVR